MPVSYQDILDRGLESSAKTIMGPDRRGEMIGQAGPPLRIGVSRCLLGDEVRYDGGHKRDDFLVDILGRYVEWVPVCPEVEAGMGIPREAIHLVGNFRHPRVRTVRTGLDVTTMMTRFSERKVRELEMLDLSGYVFKKGSPSCGMDGVRVYNEQGMASEDGVGVFARAFMERFPLIPLEEEGRLHNPVLRENFIERLFSYHRWRTLSRGTATREAIVEFHTMHQYALLAHSPVHYQSLGRLVAGARRCRPAELLQRYGALFMEALRIPATTRKHVNVLQHLIGHFQAQLSATERAELDGMVADYRKGLVPLVVPLTRVKHYVTRFDIGHLRSQVYLNPPPAQQLMLRNRVRT